MELKLPPSQGPTGWLRLERGDLAGRRYALATRMCPSPVCQCERVELQCFPEAEERSPQASGPVCLDMDLARCAIANFQQLKADPASVDVAKAIANEMSQADWNRLRSFYVGAKRELTEHADLDQLDADFPPEVLAGEGSMVGYYEILPYARPLEFTLGTQRWLLDDQHCVCATCSCQEAVLSFVELRTSTPSNDAGIEPALSIRYAYDTGQVQPLSGVEDAEWSGQAFIDALKKALPELDAVLAQRQAVLRRLYRRALRRKTVRVEAPKPGRNDPCPCGSGKKYKKCCGA